MMKSLFPGRSASSHAAGFNLAMAPKQSAGSRPAGIAWRGSIRPPAERDWLGEWRAYDDFIRISKSKEAGMLAIKGEATLAFRPIKNVELRLNVVNISDASYYEQVYQGHTVPGAGRTFLFSGNFAF
jgi:outer membrane receptor protein involved in Fe transport